MKAITALRPAGKRLTHDRDLMARLGAHGVQLESVLVSVCVGAIVERGG
jgi:hypothetical protein